MKRGEVWRRRGRYYAVIRVEATAALVYSGTTGVDIEVRVDSFAHNEKYPARLVQTCDTPSVARDTADLLSGCGGRVLARLQAREKQAKRFEVLAQETASQTEEERCQQEVKRKARKLAREQGERRRLRQRKSSVGSSPPKARQRRSRSI